MRVIACFLMILLSVKDSYGQDFYFINRYQSDFQDHSIYQALLISNSSFLDNWGLSAFSLVSNTGFSQFLIGPSYSVAGFKLIGRYGFANTGSIGNRYQVFAAFNLKNISGYAFFIDGNRSEHIFDYHIKRSIIKDVKLGIHGRRFLGHGPRLDYSRYPISFWTSINFYHGMGRRSRSSFGLIYTFSNNSNKT
ncbi:hypothetical protein [Ekhidna sp.]